MGDMALIKANKKAQLLTTRWYHNNIMNVLRMAKEKRVRDIDTSIRLGQEFVKLMDEPAPKARVVPERILEPFPDDSLMRPVEPEVLDLLYGCPDKGAAEAYLNKRYKKGPEDKFLFRVCTSWDYGWQQKQSHQLGQEVHAGKCAILRDTFYRKGNVAPDPPHMSQPTGGEFSICSQYSCIP